MADEKFILQDPLSGKHSELLVRRGIAGPPAVDISTLYREQGIFTYDPGFLSTASCRSNITYIDGNAGILRYRGYPID